MRIGIFSDTYPPFINGVSTSIRMLELELIKKGHTVYIVTVNSESMKYKQEGNVLRIPGVPTGIYDYRLTSFYPFKAFNIIKEWNLDVIHTQTEFGIGTFARVIGKQLNIPVVHTYHTMYEDYVHYITKGHFQSSSKKIVEYITKFYCDKTIKELIVPTKKTYNLFKEKYKYDRNVHIIPTGINVENFYKENVDKKEIEKLKEKMGIKKEEKTLLYLGRIGKEKSIDFIINNHVKIVEKYPNCKLVIVGNGPDIEEYKELCKTNKISDKVIFTGKVPWEKTKLYYNMADIFVTASKTETQGLTVIEAMAASTPVVAIDDESFNTTVIDDLTGYLFNTQEEYIEAIEKLLRDDELIKKMGNQGRINSLAYSSSFFAERVLNVYKLAIGDDSNKDRRLTTRMKDAFVRGIHGE